MVVRSFAAGLGVSWLLCLGVAQAGPAEDQAAAKALFAEGRALMEKGAFAQACPKFLASQKLDPKPVRLLVLADCYAQSGATASAWATFREAEKASGQAKDEARRAEAAARAAELEPTLSKLVVEVAPEARVAGLEVKRNGKLVEEALWGMAVPVDPGEQVMEAAAPGRKGWAEKVVVEGKGATVTVKVPGLGAVPKVVEKRAEDGGGKSVPLIAVGAGLGLVGIGAGVGLVLAAGGAKDNATRLEDELDKAGADGACNAQHPLYSQFRAQCDELASTIRRSDTFFNVGIGALVAGGVFAVGTLVYAVLPSKKAAPTAFVVMPMVTPTFAGAGALGSF